jgi:hypothetical protein
MIRTAFAAALLGSTILLAACNQPAESPAAPETAAAASSSIALTDPWSRETAEGQNAGGAFMTIANTGTAADRLTGGSSPVAGRVEIHTMTMEGEIMKMRQLEDGLEIPAGGEVTLKPGSFHVMLMDLKQPLKAGEQVPLSLTFAGAGTVATTLEVRAAGSMAPGMSHGEGDKPHG